MIAGAVLALVYAIVRLRRHNDPTNLVLWFGAIAYLLIIEPPLYFPAAFGIADHVDTMFAHNVFTVDFLWGRLPLYIVADLPDDGDRRLRDRAYASGSSGATASWSARSASASSTTRSTRSSTTSGRNCVGGNGRWTIR